MNLFEEGGCPLHEFYHDLLELLGQSMCSGRNIHSRFIGLARYEKSQNVTIVTLLKGTVYTYYLHTHFLKILFKKANIFNTLPIPDGIKIKILFCNN